LVFWSYLAFFSVLAVGLITMFVRGDWQKARGLDKLPLFGPLFYGAPVAAFGVEHFTLTDAMAPMIPSWIHWHRFWILFLGGCFIVAAFSLVTRVWARFSAFMFGLTFFLFVAVMHFPGWLGDQHNREALSVVFRETSFSGGALAFAAGLNGQWRERWAHILAAIGRYFVAIPVLFFSFEQFTHGRYLAGVPLTRLTPSYIPGGPIWTYLAAISYAIAGILLVANKRTRAAATWLGATVLFIELIIYVPIGIADRASLGNGLNYVADTLMFCGTTLLLAYAMPRES
jgi:hypothetical protein